MAITYTPIGYGVTDENGVAKLDTDMNGDSLTHSYTGTGAGKIDVVASLDAPADISSSSLQSGTYEVLDCMFMDYKSDGTHNTDYFKSNNATVTSSDGEITVYATSTGMYISNQVITGDFEAILQCKNVNGNGVRVGFANSNSSSFNKSARVLFTYSDYYYLKFRRVSGTWTVSRSSDGETWTDYSALDGGATLTSEDCYFMIYVQIPSGSDERRLTYKDLRIYPI